MRNCKKSAKLTAAKSLLKQIDSNNFWKNKFLSTLQNANMAPNYPADPYPASRAYAVQYPGPIKRPYPAVGFQQPPHGYRGLASSFVIPEPIMPSNIHFGSGRDPSTYSQSHLAANDIRQGQAEVQDADAKLTPQEPGNTEYNDLSHLGSIKRRRIDSLSDNEDVKVPQFTGDTQGLDLVAPQVEGAEDFRGEPLPVEEPKSPQTPPKNQTGFSNVHAAPETSLSLAPEQQGEAHWAKSQYSTPAAGSKDIVLFGAEGLEAYEVELEDLLNGAAVGAKPSTGVDLGASYGFATLSRSLGSLLPHQPLKLVPLGSFLLECMHKHKLEVDCMVLDAMDPTREVDLSSVKSAFYTKKATATDSDLLHFEVSVETSAEGEHVLVCVHQDNGIKFRVFSGLNDPNQSNQSEDKDNGLNSETDARIAITRKTAALYHADWIDQNLPAEKSILDILRLVRCWRFNTKAPIASELLDLAVSVSSSNFEESGTAKILMKFFGLLQLVVNKHHSNFYQFSEYHSFLIHVSANLTSEHEQRIPARGHPQSPPDLPEAHAARHFLFPVIKLSTCT